MKKLLPMLILLAAASGCGRFAGAPSMTVEDAVIAIPSVPGGPGAAYFTLRTNQDGLHLVLVSSPSFGRAELHGTMSSGSMTGMAPLGRDQLALSSSAPLEFAPGGKHAMLFGVDPALRPGGRAQLTFTFDRNPAMTVEAEVVGPGQAHAGH